MLTADLVDVRRRGDQLYVRALDEGERLRALAIGEAYLGLARAHVGRPRGLLLEACREIPLLARERKLGLGLLKLVLDGCAFEEESTLDPTELRDEVFARATAGRRDEQVPFDRDALLGEIAAARSVSSEVIERALYADLPDAHLLTEVSVPGPRALLATYEAGGAQAILLRATSVRARLIGAPPDAYRRLFRKLKFLRLLYRIEPILAGKPVDPEAPPSTRKKARPPVEPKGYAVTIDGPFSLFDSVTKYGLQLALAYPALTACGRWSVEADIRWGKDRKPLRFLARGEGLEADEGPPLPPEVEAVRQELAELDPRYRASVSERLLDLPGAGIVVPDLEITDTRTGRTVQVEVLGFWSRDAVWRRIDLAQHGLPEPVLFAVSKHLRVSEAALPDDLPAALYVYAHKLSARALLDRARTLLER